MLDYILEKKKSFHYTSFLYLFHVSLGAERQVHIQYMLDIVVHVSFRGGVIASSKIVKKYFNEIHRTN